MEIEGRIKLIGETQTFGASGFKKRDLVITTSEQYPQDLLAEFVQEKATLLDTYNVGEDVKVSINLRGREWINPEGVAKYFNSIQGWRIEKAQAAGPQGSAPVDPFEPADSLNDTEPDDLPF